LKRPLLAALFASALAGVDALAQPSTDTAPRPTPPPAPFVQRLEGTTVEFTLVPIPGGTLIHPIAAPDHSDPKIPTSEHVPIGPLYFSTTEVTWDLFDIFLYRLDEPEPSTPLSADAVSRPSKPYLPADRGFGHSGYPAISISFHSAKEFCKWLSHKTGRTYRLPTRDEWEYAARAETPAPHNTTPAPSLDAVAWHSANSTGKTHPVASKAANAWGLHDTLGNVAEWTIDANGKGFAAGGSYLDPPELIHPDAGTKYSPTWNESDPQIPKSKWWMADCPFVGFRIVCESDGNLQPLTDPK